MSASRAAAELPEPLARAVAEPRSYADWDALHAALTTIRRAHPFARAELPEYPPFFVASKLVDIRDVASRNDEFLSGLGGLLTKDQLAFEAKRGAGRLFRSIVAMNEPDHRSYRALTQSWFQLVSLRRFEGRIRALARRHVDRLAACDGDCDFVSEIAVHYPELPSILEQAHSRRVFLRPTWKPLHLLAMYGDTPRMNLERTEQLARRLISLPSSAGLLDT